MMSLGLHLRLIGHPRGAAGLERALDYIAGHQGVWFTRRIDIAGTGSPRIRRPRADGPKGEETDMGKLDGKVALISGGARGQGAAEAGDLRQGGRRGRLR
jgi:hypothetical protein